MKIEYRMKGDSFFCVRHYKRDFKRRGITLPKMLLDKPGLCQTCRAENQVLSPLPKVKPVMSRARLVAKMFGAIGEDFLDTRSYHGIVDGMIVLPDGSLKVTFPQNFALRGDQLKGLRTLGKLDYDKVWVLRVFGKMPGKWGLPSERKHKGWRLQDAGRRI